jgi:hypothetical protein
MTSRTSPNLSPAAYGAAIARRDQTGFVKKYGIPVHKIEGYCNNSAVQPRNLNRLQIINEDALQHYPAPRYLRRYGAPPGSYKAPFWETEPHCNDRLRAGNLQMVGANNVNIPPMVGPSHVVYFTG